MPKKIAKIVVDTAKKPAAQVTAQVIVTAAALVGTYFAIKQLEKD